MINTFYLKYKCKCIVAVIDLDSIDGKASYFKCPRHNQLLLAIRSSETNKIKFKYIALVEYHQKKEFRNKLSVDIRIKLYNCSVDGFGFIREILDKPIQKQDLYQFCLLDSKIEDEVKRFFFIPEADENTYYKCKIDNDIRKDFNFIYSNFDAFSKSNIFYKDDDFVFDDLFVKEFSFDFKFDEVI